MPKLDLDPLGSSTLGMPFNKTSAPCGYVSDVLVLATDIFS